MVFLFLRYLDLTECQFLSDILVTFPDLVILYSCFLWVDRSELLFQSCAWDLKRITFKNNVNSGLFF